MSSDKPSRGTKASSPSNPAPPGDHRKRRRNRTTQSCLNCHASKRMCDRRRPACQRCTTLGLTGSCVYEVDDPTQRDSFLDEKALLRSRIAELEGVIREMKGKPHPRWVQKAPHLVSSETRSADAEAGPPTILIEPSEDDERGSSPSPESNAQTSAGSSSLRLSMPSIRLTPVSFQSPGAASSCESLLSTQDPHFLSAYGLPSPVSSSSSSSPAPTQSTLPHVTINDASVTDSSHVDVERLLSTASLEPSGFEEGLYGTILDHIMRTDEAKAIAFFECDQRPYEKAGDACGCVNNTMTYNYILELSVRLRKAAEALGRVSDHHLGSANCNLYSRVCELDRLVSESIGNSVSPHDGAVNGRPSNTLLSPPNTRHQPSELSTHYLHKSQAWQMYGLRGISGDIRDEDSFMSWDGNRQQEWV